MKKTIASVLLLFMIFGNLSAADFADVLEESIGKQVFIYLKDRVIRYGGDITKFPLYIAEVTDDVLVLKSKSCDVVIYVAIDKIVAVEIINSL